MTWAEPLRLLWLLALPIVYWLLLPPPPRELRWTPHLAQWQAALGSLRRRPPRRVGLRVVLLLLAAAATVVAFAGPVLVGRPGPSRLVVLFDASASTGARTASGAPAFEVASSLVRDRLAALPPHVEVTLLRCGGPILRRHGASAKTMQDFGAPAGTLGADLVALAASIDGRDDTVVWTVTDGQGQVRLPDAGALSCIPAPGPNAAIVAVRVVDRWPLPTLSLAVDLVAFADGPLAGIVRATGAVAAPVERAVSLPNGAVTTLEFDVERRAEGGGIDVRVAASGDVLPGDDAWIADLPPLPAPRIGVLSDEENGPFVQAAAQALAEEVAGSVVRARAGESVGMLVVDGGAVPIEPGRVRAVCFGTRHDAAAPLGDALEPRVVDWDRDHPLSVGLDLSELRVASALPAALPRGEPFLWAEGSGGERLPLAVVVGNERTASVHFAFRLADSNLPLLPAFPQLLRRAFVRAYGTGAALAVRSPAAAAGEQDLRSPLPAADRALPPFGTPERSLAQAFVLAGLVLLALRAFVR